MKHARIIVFLNGFTKSSHLTMNINYKSRIYLQDNTLSFMMKRRIYKERIKREEQAMTKKNITPNDIS